MEITQMSGFSHTNSKTLLTCVETYDRLWENKKLSDENQRFDWIKSIN